MELLFLQEDHPSIKRLSPAFRELQQHKSLFLTQQHVNQYLGEVKGKKGLRKIANIRQQMQSLAADSFEFRAMVSLSGFISIHKE